MVHEIINKWFVVGGIITDVITIGENTTHISQSWQSSPQEIAEEVEVTHGVFFGENIKRVIQTLRNHH